ncbi:3-dehydroquinate synthase [Lewinella sp. LCG006]|uniref:3-dehydroquinate synthase n=1 Tax=Lewinella sp. LCG006 TaxID=3231911 RepID=UPI0034616251
MPVLQLDHYDIDISPIDSPQLRWLAAQDFAGIAVLTDENTAQHCLPLIKEQLAPFRPHYITIPAGEKHKTLETCQHIWAQLFHAGAGRNWCLLNLGGGVIGDMGGFCAGTFKRGIDFIQIPTTLLSQVDASVGGKLGIDFYGVKNSIGLFRDPRAVWADARFFQTLSARELRSGFAEIIKHALIADVQQWQELQHITDLASIDWSEWVARSVAIKQQIVREDPHEKGIRKALNFGHTIGHAIESYFLETTTPLLHGEAIAAGMICEAWLSAKQLGLSQQELTDITNYFLRIYGHQAIPEDIDELLLSIMRQDKKNEDARINFSLIPTAGKVAVNQTATAEEIVHSLAYYRGVR